MESFRTPLRSESRDVFKHDHLAIPGCKIEVIRSESCCFKTCYFHYEPL